MCIHIYIYIYIYTYIHTYIYIYICKIDFHKWGVPPNGWFVMENTIKPLFQETELLADCGCLKTERGIAKVLVTQCYTAPYRSQVLFFWPLAA